MVHYSHLIAMLAFLIFYFKPIFTEIDMSTPATSLQLNIETNEEIEELMEDEVAEDDPDRDNQIKLHSVGSLESMLLEAIRRKGSEICSSPFARGVMLGTWRHGQPTEEELRDSRELRRTCYNALLKTHPSTTPMPFIRGLPPILFSPIKSANDSVISNNDTILETDEHLMFSLIPKPVGPTGRLLPSAGTKQTTSGATGQYSAADHEVMQKMNEIIKDRTADCKPRKIPVDIPTENNITWKPGCALVERCGGCCQHESLHCVPTPDGITLLKKKVVAMDAKGALIGVKQVSIEKHNKCKCVCKVQAKDCNSLQTYDSRNCRCLCKPTGTKPTGGRPASPPKCTSPLYWDERSCKCRCPEGSNTDCSTGSYFSSERCRCVKALDIIKEESKRIQNFQAKLK